MDGKNPVPPPEQAPKPDLNADEQVSKVGDLGRGSQEETHTGKGESVKDPAKHR